MCFKRFIWLSGIRLNHFFRRGRKTYRTREWWGFGCWENTREPVWGYWRWRDGGWKKIEWCGCGVLWEIWRGIWFDGSSYLLWGGTAWNWWGCFKSGRFPVSCGLNRNGSGIGDRLGLNRGTGFHLGIFTTSQTASKIVIDLSTNQNYKNQNLFQTNLFKIYFKQICSKCNSKTVHQWDFNRSVFAWVILLHDWSLNCDLFDAAVHFLNPFFKTNFTHH